MCDDRSIAQSKSECNCLTWRQEIRRACQGTLSYLLVGGGALSLHSCIRYKNMAEGIVYQSQVHMEQT